MSDCIPTDVWVKILCRLQVKSLLRLRSVSKSFRDVIDSRYFVRLHLDHSAQTKSNLNVLVTNEGVLSIDYDKFDKAIRRTCPREWTSGMEYVSSFHGIVMLFDGYEFTLWNPSRRRYIYVTLPAISVPFPCIHERFRYSLGFGYNDADDDYKVVKVVHRIGSSAAQVINRDLLDDDLLKKVEVYSMKTNSWRRVQNFPFNLHQHYHATFVSGAMHWVCRYKTNGNNIDFDEFIAAFDLRTEQYRIVPAPHYYDGLGLAIKLKIGSLEGHLWAHCHSHKSHNERQVDDTWLMEDYGVRESWAKLFPSPRAILFQRPVALSRCGTYLLIRNCGSFEWYDLLRDEYEEIRVRGLYVHYKADLCVESLVHLNAGEDNEENQQIREKVLIDDNADNDDESIFSKVARSFTELLETVIYEP